MKSARINTNDFNRIISATKGFCAPSSDTFQEDFTKYIKLEFDAENSKVTASAIDGYRLSVEHALISDCDESFTAYIRPSVKLPKNEFATITLEDDEIILRCNEFMCGYKLPELKKEANWRAWKPAEKPAFRIGFNPDLLLSALQAAKASVGNVHKKPVILEFGSSPLQPVYFRTGDEDFKLVQPMRIT